MDIYNINWYRCCISISNRNDREKFLLSDKEVRGLSNELLLFLENEIKNKFYHKININQYDAYRLSDIINKNNVELINNIAFYLSKNGLYESSTILLEKIVKDYPNRIVSKLNLADNYWYFGYPKFIKNSQKSYKEYLLLMKNNKKKIEFLIEFMTGLILKMVNYDFKIEV